MLNKKGQPISLEVMFSVIVFLLLFGTTIILFYSETRKSLERYDNEMQKMKATSILTQLIESPGTPGNWHNNVNYEKPGLALESKNLSQLKLERFKTEDTNQLMDKLLLSEGFYFYLESDGNKIYEKGLDFESTENVVVQRNAIYNKKSVKVVLKLFGLEEGLIESRGTITKGIDCNQQRNFFEFDWSQAYFELGKGKNIAGWIVKNIGIDCGSLTIDKIKLQWINDTDGTTLKRIKLNGTTIWSGTSSNSNWIDVDNYVIPTLTSYSINNIFEFNKNAINNESEDFRVFIQFTDGSIYTSRWFTP